MPGDSTLRPGSARSAPYAFAIACLAGGTVLRLALDPLLGDHYPLATYYAAVTLVGWFVGVNPAIFTALLGYLIGSALFLSPRHGPWGSHLHALELPAYLAICTALIALVYRVFDRQRQLDRALQAQETAELAIAERDARFKRYFDAMPDLVYTWKADGTQEYFNPRWSEYTGTASTTDTEITERICPEDLATLAERRSQALREGIPLRAEFRLENRKGQPRWFQTRCVPIRDASAAIVGWVGRSIDIDDEKRAERARDEARQQLEVVTDRMSVGVAQCNRNMEFVWVNPAYARQVGLTPEQLQGRRIEDVLGPDTFKRVMPYITRVLAGESVQFERAETLRGSATRWISVAYTPVWNGQNTPIGWVAVVSDLTERRALEEQLLEANQQKDRFLAILAHELRNPLAPIRYATRLLKPEVPAQMAADAGRMIDRQLAHMARLLDDLMDVSRITRGMLDVRRDALDLRTILRQTVDAARPMASSVEHRLDLELPEEVLPVEGDETRLTQVVGNLINNAIKYTNPGGHIRVSATQSSTQVMVCVRDSGRGISAELLPRVFDLFTQGEPGVRAQTGLGIGLALAKQIVELHGGAIEAHSAGAGCGSEFRVLLPRGKEATAIADLPSATSNVAALGADKVRVLIVDDNADAAVSLSQLLRSVGYQPHIAHDGRSALEMAEILRPGVVLLDLGLPHMGGREVAQHLRALPWGRSMRLIAVTGWGGADDLHRSLEAGFDEHLTKPVDPDVLISHIVRLTRAVA